MISDYVLITLILAIGLFLAACYIVDREQKLRREREHRRRVRRNLARFYAYGNKPW